MEIVELKADDRPTAPRYWGWAGREPQGRRHHDHAARNARTRRRLCNPRGRQGPITGLHRRLVSGTAARHGDGRELRGLRPDAAAASGPGGRCAAWHDAPGRGRVRAFGAGAADRRLPGRRTRRAAAGVPEHRRLARRVDGGAAADAGRAGAVAGVDDGYAPVGRVNSVNPVGPRRRDAHRPPRAGRPVEPSVGPRRRAAARPFRRNKNIQPHRHSGTRP